MARTRIRSLNAEKLSEHRPFNALSYGARNFYLMLNTWMDDHGRIKDNPKVIASQLFPIGNETAADVTAWIDECEEAGMLVRYEGPDELAYIWARFFKDLQRVEHPKPSEIPPCPLDDEFQQPEIPNLVDGHEAKRNPSCSHHDGIMTASNSGHEVVMTPSGSLHDWKREEGIGINPLSPIGDVPPNAPWWDRHDDVLARDIALGIRTSKGYERDEPPEEAVLELLAFARSIAPDDDAIRSKIASFAERAARSRKREYQNPVATLRNWCQNDEAIWRAIRRNRDIDAERAKKQVPPQKADNIEHRKHPQDGLDYWIGKWEFAVTKEGNPCLPDDFDFDHVETQPGKCWIKNGVRTNERFYPADWYVSRNLPIPPEFEREDDEGDLAA